eukprot:7812748-Prorocentrum_lima.AAC.1
MTSSLVGSEMCIRDRASGPLPHGIPTSAIPVVGRRAPTTIPSSCKWPAVSYTHLTLPTICSV